MAIAVAMAAAFAGGGPVGADPDAPVSVVNEPEARSFSPNGDSYDDTISWWWNYSEPVRVWARIFDENGDVVDANLRFSPASGVRKAFGQASWDGTLQGGEPAPDGRYELRMTATDAQGDAVRSIVPVVIDRRTPGALVSPPEQTVVVDEVEVVFDPTEGFDITEFAFSFAPDVLVAPSPDGSYRSVFDVRSRPDSETTIGFDRVRWVDELGAEHEWRTPRRQIEVDNGSVRPLAIESAPDDLYLTDRTVLTELRWEFSEQARTEVEITDADGAVVFQEQSSWFGAYWSVRWDRSDLDGNPVPEGLYDLTMTATDEEGDVDVDTVRVGVLRGSVGEVVSEAPERVIGSFDVVVEVTEGRQIESVEVQVRFKKSMVDSPEPDGTYRVPVDVSRVDDGFQPVAVTINWVDPFGGKHSELAADGNFSVRVANTDAVPFEVTQIPETAAILPNGVRGQRNSQLEWSVTRPATATIVITDPDGDHHATLPVFDTNAYNFGATWTPSPSDHGLFTATMSATDEFGNTISSSVPVDVSRVHRPVTLISPSAGDTLSGTVEFVFESHRLAAVEQIKLGWSGTGVDHLVEDPVVGQTIRFEVDTTQYHDGRLILAGTAAWRSEYGTLWGYELAPRLEFTVDNSATEPIHACGDHRGTVSELEALGFNVLLGTDEPDFLKGTDGRDLVLAFGGDDVILVGQDDDVVCAGDGHDFVVAGAGADVVIAGQGNDKVLGGTGNDHLLGGLGADLLRGGDGLDRLDGGNAADQLFGGDDADTLLGGAGRDVLSGNDGDDTLNSGTGIDEVRGHQGHDTCETSALDLIVSCEDIVPT